MTKWYNDYDVAATKVQTKEVKYLHWICPRCKKPNVTCRPADQEYPGASRCGKCHSSHMIHGMLQIKKAKK